MNVYPTLAKKCSYLTHTQVSTSAFTEVNRSENN